MGTFPIIQYPISIAKGGSGATTAAAARLALSAAASGANSDITSLSGLTTALSVAQGGTGATAAGPTAAHNIGAAASGANSDITSLSGLTTPLPVTEGGTGSTTAAAAATAYGLGTGSNVQFASLGLGVAAQAGTSLYVDPGTVVNAAWTGVNIGGFTGQTTVSGNYPHYDAIYGVSEVIASGKSNANYAVGIGAAAYRGAVIGASGYDDGSGAQITGFRLSIGHISNCIVCSPTTNTCYGASVNPYILRGAISTYYGLYLAALQTLAAPSTWVLNNAYTLNTLVKPSTGNGYYFVCTTAGTSGATEPSWTASPGGTTADGAGALVWTATFVPTITNEYGVYSASTTGKNYFAGVVQFVAHVGIGQASTTTSPLSITGLPTSNAGLAATDLWNNGGVLNIGTGGVAGALPRSFSIGAAWGWSANVNWSNVTLATSGYAPYATNGITSSLTYPRVDTNTSALSNSMSFNVLLDAGTWTFGTIFCNQSNAGIFTVALDGVSMGTVDCYSSGGSDGVYTTFTGVTVTAGNHVLSLTCTSKNGSSSGYYGYIHKVVGVRTGA